MFQFVCKKLPPWRRSAFSLFCNQDMCFLQFHHFSTTSSKIIPNSNNKSEDDNKRLFTIDYIKKKIRMPLKSAKSFSNSKYIAFNARRNPVSVISFFKQQGFTSEQISCILRRHPLILKTINPDNIILPKLEFFRSIGLTTNDIAVMISGAPAVLRRSLEKQIIPVFRKAVDEVKSMGFDPQRNYFATAVFARNGKKLLWEKKVELYKSYGLSDDDVLVAFRRRPFFMTNSIEKIRKVMDYLVKRMGCEPSLVVTKPEFVSFSLEKRIVPRWNVYQALLANDLVPKKFDWILVFRSTENKFMSTFVEPFEAQVPGLLMIYNNRDPVY